MQTPNCHMLILHLACCFHPLLSWQCNFGVQLRAPGSVVWPWKCWSVTAVHCASLERTRRPWAAKVIREELCVCEVWVVCTIQWGLAKHSVLGAPQVPVWRCSRCPSTRCQLVLLPALCVSGWVLDLCVQVWICGHF